MNSNSYFPILNPPEKASSNFKDATNIVAFHRHAENYFILENLIVFPHVILLQISLNLANFEKRSMELNLFIFFFEIEIKEK